ncbi:MAG TPA: PKD domain-containing protein [Mycobacteriales bacterium]|nr:PKD domain-containing protein [Mycobacteriales bacterium]
MSGDAGDSSPSTKVPQKSSSQKQVKRASAVYCPIPIGATLAEADRICAAAGNRQAAPEPTPALVLAQLKRMDLPRGRISFQPAWGGLVNKAEIFYTTVARDRDRTITLLGRSVDVHMHIVSYHWDFGDGADLITTTPGAPYPSHEVEHVYRHDETYRLTLSLTYSATFSIAGGPPQPIDGNITVTGEPIELTIRNAHAELVGG